jgi:choline dehydrogenase-like flavoprotein
MYYVIGSGPAGIAAATALVSAGRKVTLLDGGLMLESEREARRLRMAVHDLNDWSAEDVKASRSTLGSNGRIATKLCHGSDYPYRSVMQGTCVDYGALEVRSSFAQGGLSNIWGAALLPFCAEDTHDWPVSAAELRDAHAAVLRILPVAGARDDLDELFPLPSERLQQARSSRQIERFMDDLARNRSRLARQGVIFGSARLAVRFSGNTAVESCNYCGHCMHGCPRDLIYSSRHTLRQLIESGKLVYVPNAIVEEVAENDRQVTIQASVANKPRRFDSDRIFLAAGAFNSAAIILRSLGWYERPVVIADSQYFMFPLLRMRGTSQVCRERLHTLAQMFMEISDPNISPHLVHLQVYGFSNLLADVLAHRLGNMLRFVPHNLLLSRLLIVQGFLHSRHSGHIEATLTRRGDGGSTLRLRGVASPEAPVRISRVIRRLRRLAPTLRAVPLSFALEIAQPGRSFHCGGSFPMSRRSRVGQTDILGRPHGWSRTHVVDATVFPSIPATTITQTVMANAFRIASEAARLDSAE